VVVAKVAIATGAKENLWLVLRAEVVHIDKLAAIVLAATGIKIEDALFVLVVFVGHVCKEDSYITIIFFYLTCICVCFSSAEDTIIFPGFIIDNIAVVGIGESVGLHVYRIAIGVV